MYFYNTIQCRRTVHAGVCDDDNDDHDDISSLAAQSIYLVTYTYPRLPVRWCIVHVQVCTCPNRVPEVTVR